MATNGKFATRVWRQIRRHNAPLGYMARRGTYLPPLFLSGVRGQPGFLPTPAICALSNNHRLKKNDISKLRVMKT